MQKLRLFIIGAVLAAGLMLVPAQPVAAGLFTGSSEIACQGASLDTNPSSCTDQSSTVNRVLGTGLNLFSLVVGIIAVLMIIIGGLKYITSAGDSNAVSSAKNTLLYAVIGLVIVAMAQFIVRFVIKRV